MYKFFTKSILYKITIFFVILFSPIAVYAQEYNNWILPGGEILNFNTNPASIIKDDTKKKALIILFPYQTTMDKLLFTDFGVLTTKNI